MNSHDIEVGIIMGAAFVCLIYFSMAFLDVQDGVLTPFGQKFVRSDLLQNGVYKFEDNSVCPCQSMRMIVSEECNIEIDRILSLGYNEVEFCDGGN